MKKPTRRNTPKTFNVQQFHLLIDPITDYNVKIYRAAQWYAKNKFKIVPFRSNGNGYPKIPNIPKPYKYLSQHDATYDLKQIKEWWHPETGLYPGAMIAMAHGGQSGLCAIDIDVKEKDGVKVDGVKTLTDLIYAYGEYNDGASPLDTLMATTPSQGRHLIFRYHPEIISNSEISYPGIDTRGGLKRNPAENGGITFVEPSRSFKKDMKGKTYRWDDNITDIIDMPQWLVDVLNGRPPKRGGIHLQDEYIESAPGEHGEGRDRNIYIDLLRFVGIGYTEEQLWGLMPKILERMDPPDESMVKRKIESAIQSEAFRSATTDSEKKEKASSLDLDRNDKNVILRTVKNLTSILNSPLFAHGFGDIRYDDFYHNYTKNNKPLAMAADYAAGIVIWISEHIGVEFTADVVRKYVEYTAYVKEHANVARDYMLSCPSPIEPGPINFWGSGRTGPGPAFKRLCYEVMDLNNDDLHKEYTLEHRQAYEGFLWFWMQGIVTRACVPGCKMEIMLNIFGSQGVGKSLFFRDLCPDPTWFTDSIQDTIVSGSRDNKDELTKLQSKLIVEMPELSPIKRGGKAGDDKMKQFISTQVDYFRAPYGTDTIGHPRTCALCGSSNNNDIYRDITGDRRFVSINHGKEPFKLGDHNNGVLNEIRDALWGEVVASFNPGELDLSQNELLVCIPEDLRDNQKQINSDHKYEEVGLIEVIEWINMRTRVTWQEVIAYAKSVPGLRDAKENTIIITVRQSLNNSGNFEFKRRCMRGKFGGSGTEKVNYWLNTTHPLELGHGAGVPVPVHWATWIAEQEDSEKPEY